MRARDCTSLCMTKKKHMLVSLNWGTPIYTQNIIVLVTGTPKKVPLILGNPHISSFDDIADFAADFTWLCEETEEVVECELYSKLLKGWLCKGYTGDYHRAY